MKLIILAGVVCVAAAAKLDNLGGGNPHEHDAHHDTHDHTFDTHALPLDAPAPTQIFDSAPQTFDAPAPHRFDSRAQPLTSEGQHARPVVAIVSKDIIAPQEGSYSTDFETEDGVHFSESGQAGSAGQSNVQGSYSYVSPDGQLIEVTYVADEFGFRVNSPFIPTPHPIPAHVQQQIDFARFQEEERARSQGTLQQNNPQEQPL